MPAIKQPTAPFVAELSTFVSMWQCALPFGILSPTLPCLGEIRKYTLAIRDLGENEALSSPHFVLFLFSVYALPETSNIRPFLISGETAKAKDGGRMHVISTWQWDHANRIATFWLRKDVTNAMRNDGGLIAILRTDDWQEQSTPQPMDDIRDAGLTWADELRKKN